MTILKKIYAILAVIVVSVLLCFSVISSSEGFDINNKDDYTYPLISHLNCQLLDQNGIPIKNITFIYGNSEKIAVTDNNGIFSFSGIEEGSHPITATDFSGLVLKKFNLIVKKSDSLDITTNSGNFYFDIKNVNSSVRLKAVYNTETNDILLGDLVINPETKDRVLFNLVLMVIFIISFFAMLIFVSEKFKRYKIDI